MHKSATKCNETVGKWCKNKHGASKIIDTFETYHPPLPRDEEDEDDKDYHVIKEEADVAMEDAAPPPSAGDLPPEYQTVIVDGCDEEALL
jgi:hypothetical protein